MGVAILISITIDIKLKSIRSDGDGQLILITGTILQEEVSILNIYATDMEAPTYVKETFLELKAIKPHTLIVGDFNILHLPMDRSFRDKPNREIRELIQVMNQMDLTDIYRSFHPNRKENSFFSADHGTFSKIDHILGNKAIFHRNKKKY